MEPRGAGDTEPDPDVEIHRTEEKSGTQEKVEHRQNTTGEKDIAKPVEHLWSTKDDGKRDSGKAEHRAAGDQLRRQYR
jgi:hypothetical protein